MPDREIPWEWCWEGVFPAPMCLVLALSPSRAGITLTQHKNRQPVLPSTSTLPPAQHPLVPITPSLRMGSIPSGALLCPTVTGGCWSPRSSGWLCPGDREES